MSLLLRCQDCGKGYICDGGHAHERCLECERVRAKLQKIRLWLQQAEPSRRNLVLREEAR